MIHTSEMSEASAILPRTNWGLLPRSKSLSGWSLTPITCVVPLIVSVSFNQPQTGNIIA